MSSETPNPKPKSKGWSNPAFRAMGIPHISLPSRNWSIFLISVTGIVATAVYDRQQLKQIRNHYMEQVESGGLQAYESSRLPRKLTIFVAPPPNDFLETSMKYFRKYIKPILNSAAIDFDILVANKQGDIRTSVSDRIRQLRAEAVAEPLDPVAKPLEPAPINDETKSFHDLYETKDLLGYYYHYKPITPIKDDSLDPETAGGVVCIGRGAYKEFIQGVHEGLLGPLHQPKVSEPNLNETEQGDKTSEDKSNQSIPPFIEPAKYCDAELAPELRFDRFLIDKNGVPVFFQQPIYVFPVPNILGFVNLPKKIYGFFTKRYVAEEFGERTLRIINNRARDFQYKDQFMAKEEELLWPKKWVAKGKANKSEWVQEVVIDDRVVKLLRVFDL